MSLDVVKLSSVPKMIVFAAILLPIAACTNADDWEARCAETYERATLRVDDVVSAEFECTSKFEGSYEDGRITLVASSEKEAVRIIKEIYRSYAEDAKMDMSSMPDLEVYSQDENQFDIGGINDELGFGGVPAVSQMREKYGITPSPTS